MASTFIELSLSFLLLLLTSPFSCAKHANNHHRLAEKLIRSLNLFPTDSINIASPDPSFVAPKIVEKSFCFPSLNNSGVSVEDLGHHAGYYSLPHSKAARMFYLFFESRNKKKDPVVIWLTGGPGCGSEMALFFENGPFHITNNLSLEWNNYGWDMVSNIMFVDQPTGTGFSYTANNTSDIRSDEVGISNDLYDFLQAFFKEHPQFAKNKFYITGESYAGHLIPALATRIHQGNKAKEGNHLKLKGFAIGNGLTNPEIQYKSYTDYALEMKLLNNDDYNWVNKMKLPQCEQAVKECGTYGGKACNTSFDTCAELLDQILRINAGINSYDIRKKCIATYDNCYDFSTMVKFLNKELVRNALGVGNITFVSCSGPVYEAMRTDWAKNLAVGIPALLEDGIKVLVYAGEYDLMCNWLGNSRWVQALEWSGQKQYEASPTVPFVVDGAEAGLLKSHGPLTFLKVCDAGHLVPMDQPNVSLQMLRRWMKGKLTKSKAKHRGSPK
ncbi:serine carboxypeptidase-like [Quercus lobata]|nr:serine carboxypeptidase-like [Quercus lobata]